MRDAGAGTFVSQRALADGQAVVVIRYGTATSRFVGPVGSVVTTIRAEGSVHASITTPDTKTAGGVRFESARTVYQDAVAVGYTPSQALKMLQAAHLSLARGGIYNYPILASPCASTTGGGASAKSCTLETGMQTPASGNWYLGNQISTTGGEGSPDNFSNLTWLSGWTSYPSGNSTVAWSPQAYTSQSPCSTLTWSLSYDGLGLAYSGQVCPNGEGPTSGDNGGKWTGCSDVAEGAPAVNVDHSPAGASDAVTANVKIEWALC
jgi:uncharacterized protein GlcG (DUF336 family)